MRHVADSVEGEDAEGLFRIGWIKQNASAIAAAGKNFGLSDLEHFPFRLPIPRIGEICGAF